MLLQVGQLITVQLVFAPFKGNSTHNISLLPQHTLQSELFHCANKHISSAPTLTQIEASLIIILEWHWFPAFRVLRFSTELKIEDGTRSQHFAVVQGSKSKCQTVSFCKAKSVTEQSNYIDHLQHPPWILYGHLWPHSCTAQSAWLLHI